MGKINLEINDISFKNDANEYLDVIIHREHSRPYITLDTTHHGKYIIENIQELNIIYKKLKEILSEKI